MISDYTKRQHSYTILYAFLPLSDVFSLIMLIKLEEMAAQ